MEKGRVNPKKLLDNISVLRENLQLMRRTLRGLIGIPLLTDMFENLPEERQKSRRLTGAPNPPPGLPDHETPSAFEAKELAQTAENVMVPEMPKGLPQPGKSVRQELQSLRPGFVDIIKEVLQESARQVKLRSELMEAQVQFYKKRLEHQIKEEEKKRKPKGVHY